MTLRSKLIRLAHEKPALRKDLLPLLKTAEADYVPFPEDEKKPIWVAWSEVRDSLNQEWEQSLDYEPGTPSPALVSLERNLRGLDKTKAMTVTPKIWEILSDLYLRDWTTKEKLDSWMERINNVNSIASLGLAGQRLLFGKIRPEDGYFGANWGSEKDSFRKFGRRVQFAAKDRFWKIAGLI